MTSPHLSEMGHLRDENALYREALEFVVAHADDECQDVGCMVESARAALARGDWLASAESPPQHHYQLLLYEAWQEIILLPGAHQQELARRLMAAASEEVPDAYWDLDRINAEATDLRKIRDEQGPGAMLAHAAGIPLDEWRRANGIDRPAGET